MTETPESENPDIKIGVKYSPNPAACALTAFLVFVAVLICSFPLWMAWLQSLK